MAEEGKPKMEIKTAGDLRGFLAGILGDIKDGKVSAEQAGAISKVASQINQSLATEVNAALQLRRLEKRELDDVTLSIDKENTLALEPPKWCEQCERRVDGSKAASCKDAYCKAKALFNAP